MKPLYIIPLLLFLFKPMLGDDLSSLSAVKLNKKGYRLNEQKKYASALLYFRNAIKKQPDLAHVNI